MKKVLRNYAIDTFSLWVVANIARGLIFENGIKTFLIAGFGVTIISHIAKPVINLLLLPLNLITFGIFRWVSSAIVIYVVSLVVDDFKVIAFNFSGFSSKWFDFPAINLQGTLSYIGFSFLLSIISSFIYWLIK
ncbi:hypothetical protein A2686_05010 [Candidatus Woesebacteria bacterium RIFCSPHIGHO2_01_FULL_38_10]|uniref:Uncharacterized protein n=1 Tax=Candidatus Woesebacteria bacterium RIFCSPLOWO2_01_FULL_39_10b TaxID=1802517 RepID=A0A1F8B618_9BACT|nr:MAG: hypothetical protein A2686_05010 [Candidatus Woesebacteria bacterium RIFCSPHIGHO2_01_FULL_38_10]OGM59483.1 MAG: hypothetical protein A2892_02450 [Candidatus Woesebacteria bacterium RIFCSPLOWO2_01_FULL_39_10b]